MFGYLKPFHPGLHVCEEEFYRAVYCGLCRAQKKQLGDLASLTLSYDAVFLALVRLAATGENFTITRKRCIVHPMRKRAMLSPCDALGYSAMATALLAYHNLRDELRDERGAKKLRAALMLPVMQTFRGKCGSLTELDNLLADKLSVLYSLEKENCAVPDLTADAFGGVLAEVASFGLEGVPAKLTSDIGMHLGRWIYLIDAADDYKKDLRSGSYNPFIACGTDKNDLRTLVLPALECERIRLASTLELIEYPESAGAGDTQRKLIRAVLENTAYMGMKYQAELIFNTGKACREEET